MLYQASTRSLTPRTALLIQSSNSTKTQTVQLETPPGGGRRTSTNPATWQARDSSSNRAVTCRCNPEGSRASPRQPSAGPSAVDSAVATQTGTIAPVDRMAQPGELGVLPAREDAYGGMVVVSDGLPTDPDEFDASLGRSLKIWGEFGKKGIWLSLPLEQAALVPIAVKHGFAYHHAEPEYLMLNQWLPDTPSTLPPNASHQVGVGGFVLNERREVLVVQERNGPLKGKGVWKMPTGLVSEGEDLHEAAAREILEETGIRARFEAVLAVRQSHGMAFGKSDMFFVCALRADSDQTFKICTTEIHDVQWIPLHDFCNIEFMKGRQLYAEVCLPPRSSRCDVSCSNHALGSLRGTVFDPLRKQEKPPDNQSEWTLKGATMFRHASLIKRHGSCLPTMPTPTPPSPP